MLRDHTMENDSAIQLPLCVEDFSPPTQFVRKRDGSIQPFSADHILRAITAALIETEEASVDIACVVTEAVLVVLADRATQDAEYIPAVEEIQDIVEAELMRADLVVTAKAYILYRAQRTQARAQEAEWMLDRVERSDLMVVTRTGQRVPFDIVKITTRVRLACVGLSDIDRKVDCILNDVKTSLYDGISTREIDEALINVALQNVKDDIEFDIVATRILTVTVYEDVFDDFDTGSSPESIRTAHRDRFPQYIAELVKLGQLDVRMQNAFDLNAIAKLLDPSRDGLFMYAGLSTMLHRYTIKGPTKRPFETPQFTFMRVAMGVSMAEKNPTEAATLLYEKMSRLEYLPGGSTFLSAGSTVSSVSNCFLIQVEDDMAHIAKSVADVLLISKASGGIGLSVSKLRATGSTLQSSNTVSSGPTPFAKIFDTAIRAIIRGGKKKGALAFYMENWHFDFEEYLDWRQNAGDDYMRMRTADTAVLVSDEFMKRVQSGDDWYFFDPKETPDLIELFGRAFSVRYREYCRIAEEGGLSMWKKTKAVELYRKILVALITTSHPWIVWKDAINLRALNDNTGTIHMSNLCTEICLPQDRENIAVCNLASVNLPRHIDRERTDVDWDQLQTTVRVAVRHLDNLIDINTISVAEAKNSDEKNRAVGLGCMGLADCFEQLGIAYESPQAGEFTDRLFEFISYVAIDESANLARDRGSYPNFAGSGWSKGLVPIDTIARMEDDRGVALAVDQHHHYVGLDWDALRIKVAAGMRNATLMAVAPNANIGLVGGTTPGMDVRFAQIFSRNKFSGKYLDINHNLVRDLQKLGIWDSVRDAIIESHGDIEDIPQIPDNLKAIYRTSFGTSQYGVFEVTARAQKWIDQAISRNVYLRSRDVDEAMQLYTTAWSRGVKTTYYLHVEPRHSAEQSTVTVNKGAKIGLRGFGALRKSVVTETESVPIPTVEVAGFTCPTDPALRAQCDSCQ